MNGVSPGTVKEGVVELYTIGTVPPTSVMLTEIVSDIEERKGRDDLNNDTTRLRS